MGIEKFDLKSAKFLYDIRTRIKYSSFFIFYQVGTASSIVACSSFVKSNSNKEELRTSVKSNPNLLILCLVNLELESKGTRNSYHV